MHAHYYYASDHVKGLLQENTLLVLFLTISFLNVAAEVVDTIMQQCLVFSTFGTLKNLKISLPDLIIATTNKY